MNLNPTFENASVTSNPQNADIKEIKVSIRSGHEVTEYTFQYKAIQGVTNDQLLQQIKDTNHVFHQRIASMIDLHKAIQETQQDLHPDITRASLLQKGNGKVRIVTPLGSTSPSKVLGEKGIKLGEFKASLEQPSTPPSFKTLAKKIDVYLKQYGLSGTGTLQLMGTKTTSSTPAPSSTVATPSPPPSSSVATPTPTAAPQPPPSSPVAAPTLTGVAPTPTGAAPDRLAPPPLPPRNPTSAPSPTVATPSPSSVTAAKGSPASTAPLKIQSSDQAPLPHLGNSCYINTALQIIAHFEPLYQAFSNTPQIKTILDDIRSNKSVDIGKFLIFITAVNSSLNSNDQIKMQIVGNSHQVKEGGDVRGFILTLLRIVGARDRLAEMAVREIIVDQTKMSLGDVGETTDKDPSKNVVMFNPTDIENLGGFNNVKPKMVINGQTYRLEVVVFGSQGHTYPYIRNQQNQLCPLDDIKSFQTKRTAIDLNTNAALNSQFPQDQPPLICMYVKESAQASSPLPPRSSSSSPSARPLPPIPSTATTSTSVSTSAAAKSTAFPEMAVEANKLTKTLEAIDHENLELLALADRIKSRLPEIKVGADEQAEIDVQLKEVESFEGKLKNKYQNTFNNTGWHGRSSFQRILFQEPEFAEKMSNPAFVKALLIRAQKKQETALNASNSKGKDEITLSSLVLLGLAGSFPSYLATAAPNWVSAPKVGNVSWDKLKIMKINDKDQPEHTKPDIEHLKGIQKALGNIKTILKESLPAVTKGAEDLRPVYENILKAPIAAQIELLKSVLNANEGNAEALTYGAAGLSTMPGSMNIQTLEVMSEFQHLLAHENGDYAAVLGYALVSHALDARHLIASIWGMENKLNVASDSSSLLEAQTSLKELLDGCQNGSLGPEVEALMKVRLNQVLMVVVGKLKNNTPPQLKGYTMDTFKQQLEKAARHPS